MGPRAPRVGDKCGRQVGDNSCGPRNPEWETRVKQVEDKCKLMRPNAPRVGDKCRRQVGNKCKLMRPKKPRVGDKCGRQVGDKCKLMRPKEPRVGDQCGKQVWKTSVSSCGPRNPEWETSA